MKTFTKSLAVLGITGAAALTLAPLAAADTPPPIQPGSYTFHGPGGGSAPENIAWDCGPDCFSVNDSRHTEFRLQPDGRWVAESGAWTVDGVNFDNPKGQKGTLTR